MLHSKIPKSEYSPQVTYYSSQAYQGETATEVLLNSKNAMLEFIASIPDDKVAYKYGKNKWTTAEVLQHVIYYEEIMYEKMLIAINEAPTNLKYNYYTQSGTAAAGLGKSKHQLIEEYIDVRDRMIALIDRLSENELKLMGSMDGFSLSVRMFVLCASGHQHHHFNVIRDKYLE